MVGLGLATIVPIVYSRAGNTQGIDAGTGISMVTTIGYSGFIVGPPILGFLAEWRGLQISYLFVLALFIIMFALTVLKKAFA